MKDNRVRYYRKLWEGKTGEKLTQIRLAEIIGVSKQTIIHWEKQSWQPNIFHRTKLAEFFQIKVEKI